MQRTILTLFLIWAAIPLGCRRSPPTLSLLGNPPHWSLLDAYQETMTREDFIHLLEKVYVPGLDYQKYLEVRPDHARIRMARDSDDVYRLRFAASTETRKAAPHYWRIDPIQAAPPGRPLAGLKIALDPGHLGGEWARMEERWFRVGTTPPVAEGDLNLAVAKLLGARLTRLGAEVYLVRSSSQPLTEARPESFRALAESHPEIGPQDLPNEERVRHASELLFYRVSEIRSRARLINEQIRPDLVICLHFNTENWGDPEAAKLVERNHLHLVVNGAYTADELAMDDVRLEMLQKLLSGAHREELAVSEKIAAAFVEKTGLQPCYYPGEFVKRIGPNPYLFARNLLANRLYQAPVVYLEPYVMNNPEVFARIQLGDYEGKRRIGDQLFRSIFREYADAVVQGLLSYYSVSKKGVYYEGSRSALDR